MVSCPCALVISVPLSFFAGIGCASKNGILIKGSNYLEQLAKTKYLAMDKTGTVTKGVFEVVDVINAEGFTKEQVVEYAAYCEFSSNHPIALSIKNYYGKKADMDNLSDIREIAGHGVCAKVFNKDIAVGNKKLMDSIGVDVEKVL